MFSEGYADQFGRKEGKKYMVKNFKNLLVKNSLLTPEEQHKKLELSLNRWKKDHDQIDDILVWGIHF